MQEPQVPNWIQIAGGWATVAILIGAVILWGYALRFYLKIQANLRVPRNALYLVLVICLNWISPIAFMILEGKDRFFEVAFE